ncbi:uncharacterized protein LOC115745830 isoform X2 [Rhodamnia argentea]|uniref:Uncharacterized protein LOC115745830 isoform X2 n=1 Tax=Rhodamnia argentea TaxID=178133 RepID=A0A8B8PR95_9MYRT|nr:uncharacterized protein LOC115745830 isoform X2 [Rhodamnia argentea]
MASQKDTFNAKWNETSTNYFVSLMVEEVKKGNRTSCTFNKTGWKNIRIAFNNKIGFQYTQVQLRNKHNKLRIQYGSFKKLLGQSGFGWDNVNKKVTVDDPSIWELHLKDNNEWAKFKKDGFPIYLELCIIFGGTYATGEQAIGTGQNLPLSDDDNCEDDGNDFVEGFGDHHLDEEGFTPANPSTPVHDNHNLDRTPNTKRRKKSNQYNLTTTCKTIEDMIKSSSATSRPLVQWKMNQVLYLLDS